jgi:D-3-phosphoglycerate dehydrogenase
MRVLVADRLSEDALDEMRALGVEVEYEPHVEAVELPGRLEDINVLIVRGTEVKRDALAAGRSLNLVIRAGAGTQNIDVAYASERGIYVAVTPGRNAQAVAELAFTLIGCLDRRVPDASAAQQTFGVASLTPCIRPTTAPFVDDTGIEP